MQRNPHYDDVVTEVADFFDNNMARALECGIDPMAIAFDPGIGFGKTVEHNLTAARQSRAATRARSPARGRRFTQIVPGENDWTPAEMSDRAAPTIALTAIAARTRRRCFCGSMTCKGNAAALRASRRRFCHDAGTCPALDRELAKS